MMKRLMLSAAAVLLTALCGCESFEQAWEEAMTSKSSFSLGEEYKPKYLIGLYQIVKYPRAGDLESEISTFDGKKLWINTNQFFSSKNIKEIKLLPRADRPDCYNLALRLDERGCRIWTMLAMQFREDPLALMVDSYYHCQFNPKPLENEDSDWVIIEYPFNEVTAKGLEKYAADNYKHFNPSPTSLF